MTGQSEAEVLSARARRLAEREASRAKPRAQVPVVIVRAGSAAYGLPVPSLREILRAPPIAPLPALPAFLAGLTTVRGELMCVVDLGELHGEGKTGAGALLAVVESPRGAVALRIEEVVGTRDVLAEEGIPDLLDSAEDAGVTAFVTRDLLRVVDVERLLGSDRLVVGASRKRAASREPTP